jgi:excinuclease UvrABC nuclease subunit
LAEKSYELDFVGYWREVNVDSVPDDSGVYCVYACRHTREGEVSIRLLIWIGEAKNVRSRIKEHGKLSDWKGHLREGEVLCFNYAQVKASDRQRVEAALIFHHKPPENDEYKDAFPFDKTNIKTKGRSAKLSSSFSVERTP